LDLLRWEDRDAVEESNECHEGMVVVVVVAADNDDGFEDVLDVAATIMLEVVLSTRVILSKALI
jgi:hypothetical protein